MAVKRPAERYLDAPEPKKGMLDLLSRLNPWPYSASNLTEGDEAIEQTNDMVETTAQATPPAPPQPPLTVDMNAVQRQLVVMTNEIHKLEEAEAGDRELKDPKRLLRFKPDIMPDEAEWDDRKSLLIQELADGTVQSVLDKYFEEGQKLLLLPPPTDGVVLEIQKRNAADYKVLLANGGRFNGQGNNLVTKLTMLHFGLPIAPLTMNNILNAGKEPKTDDPEDDLEQFSRVQRIMFSEKPLEFLDSYNERNYGFPILRRAKSRARPSTRVSMQTRTVTPAHRTTSESPPATTLINSRIQDDRNEPVPILPAGAVTMRGGTGSPENLSWEGYKGYIYSHKAGRLEVDHKVESFVEVSLKLLGLNPKDDWEFMVDQYNNNENEKGKPAKERWDKGNSKSNKISKRDQSAWQRFILPRVMHFKKDWMMAVDYVRPPGKEAPLYLFAATRDGIGKPNPAVQQSLQEPTSQVKSPGSQPQSARPREKSPPGGIPASHFQSQLGPGGFTSQGPVELNKDRASLRRTAAQEKPAQFGSWIKESNYQDRRQRESYIRDQSVIEPGHKPEAPLYGASRELEFALSTNLPTIYAQRLTPTDIGHLMDENQHLRNQVLERMVMCTICQASFEGYKNEDIRGHWKAHVEQITTAGVCPICADNTWVFMDVAQKRAHLKDHQDRDEGDFVRDFWAGMECPCCDIDLRRLGGTDQILIHLVNHQPNVLQFCDRCSLHLKGCTRDELEHHQEVCINAPEKWPSDIDCVFCENCGKDRTVETAQQRTMHIQTCQIQEGFFCTTCGYEKGGRAEAEIIRHEQHCRAPRGIKKKFCKRCATNLSLMSNDQIQSHKGSCFGILPDNTTDKERIQELNALIAKHSVEDAKRNHEKFKLEVMRKKLQSAVNEHERKQIILADHMQRMRQIQEFDHATQVAIQEVEAGLGLELPSCPFETCKVNLGNMSRRDLVNHFATHRLEDDHHGSWCGKRQGPERGMEFDGDGDGDGDPINIDESREEIEDEPLEFTFSNGDNTAQAGGNSESIPTCDDERLTALSSLSKKRRTRPSPKKGPLREQDPTFLPSPHTDDDASFDETGPRVPRGGLSRTKSIVAVPSARSPRKPSGRLVKSLTAKKGVGVSENAAKGRKRKPSAKHYDDWQNPDDGSGLWIGSPSKKPALGPTNMHSESLFTSPRSKKQKMDPPSASAGGQRAARAVDEERASALDAGTTRVTRAASKEVSGKEKEKEVKSPARRGNGISKKMVGFGVKEVAKSSPVKGKGKEKKSPSKK